MVSVLDCSGCFNKIEHAGWLMNDRNLFLMVLEDGKSKVKELVDLMSVKTYFLAHRCLSFHCVLT
jgi:hypothetical protein